jgi:hypothetical protein
MRAWSSILPKSGPDGGDHARGGRRALCQHVEQLAVFADGHVIEIRVAAVQQRTHAARFDMADQFLVGVDIERQIRAARERRDCHHGRCEFALDDLGLVHKISWFGWVADKPEN